MNQPIGLYIHVPFCLSKCPYCDFYSVKHDGFTADSYTDALCRAIEKSPYTGRSVDTIYFGGGTPVLLGARNLEKVLKTTVNNFNFTVDEATIEANPAAASKDLLRDLRKIGFNRISFGVQSGVDAELSALGRLHDAQTARDNVLEAYEAGFSNISADLMLGIPLQTQESLAYSIDFFTALPLSHISAYLLKIEAQTPFYAQNTARLCPDEDTLSALYLDCVNMLFKKGFEQYEISNFAKNAAVSRHNLKYWKCGEYLGLGPSAHSFMDGSRFYFPRGLGAFISAENPFSLIVPDGDGGGFEEYAMLRLRLREGLNLTKAAALYGADTSCIAEKARALERNRLLTITGDVVALTPEGFLLSNSVTAALLFG